MRNFRRKPLAALRPTRTCKHRRGNSRRGNSRLGNSRLGSVRLRLTNCAVLHVRNEHRLVVVGGRSQWEVCALDAMLANRMVIEPLRRYSGLLDSRAAYLRPR